LCGPTAIGCTWHTRRHRSTTRYDDCCVLTRLVQLLLLLLLLSMMWMATMLCSWHPMRLVLPLWHWPLVAHTIRNAVVRDD
jgi:hypothetical protein